MKQQVLVLLSALFMVCFAETNGEYDKTQLQYKHIVHDKTKETLNANLKTAFYQVLSKRSGKIINDEFRALQTVNIQSMVERYEYHTQDCDDENIKCYQLVITFNEEAINGYMQTNQIPIWTGPRPSTLIWLQKKSQDGLQTFDEYHPEAIQITKQASQRGMIILLPNGDITDQQIIPEEAEASALDFLASKYQAQQILYGIIEQDEPMNIAWHLFNPSQNDNWESTNNNLSEAFNGALDHIVNRSLVNHTEHERQTTYKTVIEIKQLNDYDTFNQLNSRLLNNEAISKIDIINIGVDFFTIEITHQNNTQSLLEQLRNVTYLQSSIESPQSNQAISSYQWIPPVNH